MDQQRRSIFLFVYKKKNGYNICAILKIQYIYINTHNRIPRQWHHSQKEKIEVKKASQGDGKGPQKWNLKMYIILLNEKIVKSK